MEDVFTAESTFGTLSLMNAEDLRNWRERMGMTREELARELKTSYATVFRWEQGPDQKDDEGRTLGRSIPPYLELALKQIETTRKKKR